MQLTSDISTNQAKHRQSWPNLILWTLCLIPLLHVALLASLDDLQSGPAVLVHHLRPIGTLGAAAMLFYVASRGAGRHRWSWTFFGVAILLGALFSFLRVNQNISVATLLLRVLVILIYVCALIGTALYLQQRTWWLGSTWRVIIGSITIGMGVLVLMRTVLPLTFPAWPWNPYIESTLSFLAFDTGMLFAFTLITMRYGQEHSRLLQFIVLGLVCLLIADSLFMLLSWMPGGVRLQILVLPLYTLHAVLLALGAYRDVTHISTDSKSIPATMPLIEWLLWVLVPLVVTVAAFTAASILGMVSPALIIALAIITVGHEVLAMFDYQRIIVALHKAQLEAADAATMRERNTIAREIHDGLGHYFTGVGSQLQATRVLLDVNRDRAINALGKAQRLADEGLDEVRRSISALRENPLGARSLPEAIAALLDNAKSTHLVTLLDVHGTSRPLSADVEMTLYRTAQEGITNALKHAQAHTIRVMIDYRPPNQVRLTIHDDGRGAASTEGGFGLVGIQERIELVGGKIQLVTAPEQGWTISVEVPA